MTDSYIVELPNGYKSLIDDRNFLKSKLASKEICRLQAEAHVRCLIQNQDGGIRQERTLSERKSIWLAMATP